jgi:hypothetical protein
MAAYRGENGGMGLFSQLPEEPTEWAGLPSEPARAESSAERLPDAAPVDLGGLGVGGIGLAASGGDTVEAIVIPVAAVVAEDAATESDSSK